MGSHFYKLRVTRMGRTFWGPKIQVCRDLRCFDIVFQRPCRYFAIALKVILYLSDRYNIFTDD